MNPKLIERYRNINTDYEWWEHVYDTFTDNMRRIGIGVDRMYFRGFWSQGDGACFDGYVSHWERFLPSVGTDYTNSVLIDHARRHFQFSSAHKGYYTHERSVSYDADLPLPESSIDMDFAEEYSPYPLDDLRTAAWLVVLSRFTATDLERDFREAFTGHMQDLYRDLEEEYDHLTSDEAVWDSIVANGMHLNEEENNDE